MRHLIVALILVCVSGWLVSCAENAGPKTSVAPPVTQAQDPKQTEAEIIQLEKDWVAAIQKKDLATLGQILADDFAGTSITGGTFRKTDAIEDIEKGIYVVQSMTMDEVSVNVYDDAAVAFTSQDEKSTYAGKDSSGHFHFTNTWIKRNGKWQVVASHGSPYKR